MAVYFSHELNPLVARPPSSVWLNPRVNNIGVLPSPSRTWIRDVSVLGAVIGVPVRDPIQSPGWGKRLGDIALNKVEVETLVRLDQKDLLDKACEHRAR